MSSSRCRAADVAFRIARHDGHVRSALLWDSGGVSPKMLSISRPIPVVLNESPHASWATFPHMDESDEVDDES
jgi:hypothetical protein